MATSDPTAAITEKRMRNVLFIPPTLGIRLKIEAKSRQETSRRLDLKVFLAGRVAVEADDVVIDERHFPGRQGRLLFAYLVVEHGRPVPRDELADVLWADAPPATWDKALSVLVSKLRGVLAESGVDGASALTAAFGCYQLDLPEGTWVDVHAAASAAKEAEGFLETDEPDSATAAAALAESVTRSPFLPGDEAPWVEETRRELADVRARALSALAEASLRTDKAAQAVRWAGLAVEAEPFRESGYRRLMEAHVAAGNRGEALRVYERCRRLLAEELGAYPSPETESIYRGLLDAPPGRSAAAAPDETSPLGTAPPPARRGKRPVLAAAALFVLVAFVAAGTAVLLNTRGDRSNAASGVAASPQVALVVPTSTPWGDDPSNAYQHAVDLARTEDGIGTRVLPIDLRKKPGLAGLSTRARKSLETSDLVLLAGQSVGTQFVRAFAQHPHTRFVVLDPDPINTDGPLYNAVSDNPNTSDVFFIEGPGAYLAGFLSALMAQSSGKRPVVVSEILVNESVSANVVNSFITGAQAAVPGVEVLKRYAGKFSPPSVCETIANNQIERGSRVVYADAGACSAGAQSAVEAHRGVWGVEADQAPSTPFGPRILGYTVKNFGQEVDYAIRHYVNHTLSHRHHVDIGIERGAVEFDPNPDLIPERILARLERLKQRHAKTWAHLATP
jgi:DNA-binding SARP family transcriptional activator/basic membrane lipoprotein Med (substrate-binding protein (PBP1-ABC) superfamily)